MDMNELKATIGSALDTLKDAMHGEAVRGEGPDLLGQRLEVVKRKLTYGYEMVTTEMEKPAE